MCLIMPITKQKLVIWIPEVYYPKIDEIRCIVDKTILTFFVSVKIGYMNDGTDGAILKACLRTDEGPA